MVHAWQGLAVGRGAERAHSWGVSMLCSIMAQTGRATKAKAGPVWEKMGCRWSRRVV